MGDGVWVGAAPFVLSMRFAQGAGGARLAEYIGTRAGVAAVQQEEAQQTAGLVRYAAERPGSTGLFGADPQAPPDLAATQEALAAAPWHYRIVLSMRGPDAERVGLGEDAQKWRDMARRWLPGVAKELGVPQEAMHWVGAMHHKEGKDGVSQPHLHVLAWIDPPARRPLLSKEELRRVRRATAREVFGPLRGALSAEKTARRDAAILAARAALGHGAIASRDEAELGRRLRALGKRMPGHGRIAMAYMPPEVRAEAEAVAAWVMERPALSAEVAGLDKAARDLAALYGTQPEALDAAAAKALADVRGRIAQVVLKAAASEEAVAKRATSRQAQGVVREARGLLVGATREAEAEADWAQRQRAMGLGLVR